MTLPVPPNINQGEIALDPVNGIVYYKDGDDQLVSTTWNWLQDNLTSINTSDDVTISGNLTVSGTTVSVNVESVTVADNILVLNSNVTGSPTENAGIEIERGTSTNVSIRWNETTDTWQYTNDGTTYLNLSSIIENSVELGLHTTGDYVESITAGTGVTVSFESGEGVSTEISIGQSVSITDTVTFAGITAPLTGNVTGDVTGTVSDISNHGISDLSDVAVNDAANGDFLRYNGSNWINDPVNLATDTIGDYVSRLAAGTGITITNNSGEGATPNISFSGSINDLSDLTITSAQNGQILEYDGTAWVNTVRPSSEPIGHENKADSVISFNEGTRTFSIAPVSTSYTVWCAGKRYVKTSTETLEIPDTSGLYYIYFNSSGALAYRTTFFVWDTDTPTAYIYWNEVDNKAYFFADERHGVTLDWATHEYLHRTRGAAIANGFGANNYTLVGDGSLDAHAKIDIANGTFFDEDLQVDIEHSASPTANTWQQRLQSGAYIPVFYRLNNHWTKDVATQFPVKNGGTRAQFNLNTAGTWSASAIDNSKYGVMFVVATNNLNEPIISIMGQAQYTDKGSAEASIWDDLDLGGFPIVEFRPLYKIVFQTGTAYANSPKTRFVNLLDLRQIISAGIGGAATAVSDHGLMTGLQDDDHTQYLLADGTRTAASLTVSGAVTASSIILDGIEIDAATPSDTNVLKYDASLNKYIPGVASTVASLDDLTDVIINSATPNQVIKFNGTNWVNDNVPSSGIAGTTYSTVTTETVNTAITVAHNLSTRNIVVSLTEETSPYGAVNAHWEATDLNSVTIYFATPPGEDGIRINVYAAVTGSQAISHAETIGLPTSTIYTINHNLGTRDIILQARNVNSPYESLNIAWEATTINTATVYFDSPPELDSVRIKVIS